LSSREAALRLLRYRLELCLATVKTAAKILLPCVCGVLNPCRQKEDRPARNAASHDGCAALRQVCRTDAGFGDLVLESRETCPSRLRATLRKDDRTGLHGPCRFPLRWIPAAADRVNDSTNPPSAFAMAQSQQQDLFWYLDVDTAISGAKWLQVIAPSASLPASSRDFACQPAGAGRPSPPNHGAAGQMAFRTITSRSWFTERLASPRLATASPARDRCLPCLPAAISILPPTRRNRAMAGAPPTWLRNRPERPPPEAGAIKPFAIFHRVLTTKGARADWIGVQRSSVGAMLERWCYSGAEYGCERPSRMSGGRRIGGRDVEYG